MFLLRRRPLMKWLPRMCIRLDSAQPGRSEVTEITSEVLLQAMAKNPAERFGSYDEFIMAMEMSRTNC